LQLFFSHAFRPFFLGAGIYAALAMAAWIAWIGVHMAGGMPRIMSVAEPLHLWHAHEMTYGFAGAAAGGFLLTAVPNWTGARHSHGAALALMFAMWCAGRLVMWNTAFIPPSLAALVDLAFLPVLGFAAARQLAVQPALRNVIFLSLIVALVIGNAIYHFGRMSLLGDGMHIGVVLGVCTLALMIIVIGGRVVPAFTTNALRRKGVPEHRLPVQNDAVNKASLILSALALLLFVVAAGDRLAGLFALFAAAANGVRLARWRGLATLDDPIVWVLHLGYGWIVAGFLLLGTALLTGWVGEISALHAFATGAVGTMILAIMSRASLGHTGRAIIASPAITAAYLLVSAAALLRCFGPALAPRFFNEVMLLAGVAWIAAFGLFSLTFLPILTAPRVARPG